MYVIRNEAKAILESRCIPHFIAPADAVSSQDVIKFFLKKRILFILNVSGVIPEWP